MWINPLLRIFCKEAAWEGGSLATLPRQGMWSAAFLMRIFFIPSFVFRVSQDIAGKGMTGELPPSLILHGNTPLVP